jgi:broad specificity phosphatase PhoE
MDLCLIRHGQSLGNAAGKLIADEFDRLSPLGVTQSTRLAKRLQDLSHNPTLVFSSPWARARETAECIYSTNIAINFDSRLAETNPGKYGTWIEAEFNRKFPLFGVNIENIYDGGESHLDMAARVCNWVDEEVLPRSSGLGLISVVAHGGPISIILQYLLDIPIKTRYPSFSVPNASFSILRWRADLSRFCLICAGHE